MLADQGGNRVGVVAAADGSFDGIQGSRQRALTSPTEYAGQACVAVQASAVPGLTPTQNARLVDEWCDFFSAGPTGIRDLSFPMRMPKRLFAALASQTQLRRLAVLTGIYDDLCPLAAMTELWELELESATSVTSLEPVRHLARLESLRIGGLHRLRDYSPVADITGLRQLELGFAYGQTYADSYEFVRDLGSLRMARLCLIPAGLRYEPLLALTHVEDLAVYVGARNQRKMTPTLIDLEWALPGIQRCKADIVARRTYEWRRGERIGHWISDDEGTATLVRYDPPSLD